MLIAESIGGQFELGVGVTGSSKPVGLVVRAKVGCKVGDLSSSSPWQHFSKSIDGVLPIFLHSAPAFWLWKHSKPLTLRPVEQHASDVYSSSKQVDPPPPLFPASVGAAWVDASVGIRVGVLVGGRDEIPVSASHSAPS